MDTPRALRPRLVGFAYAFTATLLSVVLFGFPSASLGQDAPAGKTKAKVQVNVQAKAKGAADAPEVSSITARELGLHLEFLASDAMRGRDTGSGEIRIAGEYIAGQLRRFGALPAGEEADAADEKKDDVKGKGESARTYFQNFPLEFTEAQEDGTQLTLTVKTDGKTETRTFPVNQAFFFNPRGVKPGVTAGGVVDVGYGIVNPDAKRDDYAGADVKGRWVIIRDGLPEGVDRSAPGTSFAAKQAAAESRGAAGILMIHPFGDKDKDKDVPPYAVTRVMLKRLYGRGSVSMSTNDRTLTSSLPLLYLDKEIREVLLPDGKAASTVTEAKFTYKGVWEKRHCRNVVGMFPGSDPKLSREVLIFSAHYDHVGVDARGRIFNGSDDNGSGTSALLEIAEAVGKSPLHKRTIVFLWVSGEEKGLWGSRWFSDHSTLPEDMKIIANINMDMVSRNNPKEISITPSPNHRAYNTLTQSALKACAAEGIEAVFDADQYFDRTDSTNFARKGIPVVFFFSGIHEDYHQPTDDFPKADLDKAAAIARLSYRLGWEIANAPDTPHKIEREAAKPKTSPSEKDEPKKTDTKGTAPTSKRGS